MKHCLTVLLSCAMSCPLLAQPTSLSTDIQSIAIEVKTPDWQDVLDSLRINGDEFLPATVIFHNQKEQQAGIRYRAFPAFTPGEKRNPLEIKLADGQLIQLSHSLRDPSKLRETIAAWIIGQYIPCTGAKLTKVVVNDEFYALLTQTETVDNQFFEKYFEDDKGDHFVSDPQLNTKPSPGCPPNFYAALRYSNQLDCYQDHFQTDGDWKSLQTFTYLLNHEPEKISDRLHLHQTIWMLALNNVLVHLNSYSGRGSRNYQLYRDENGLFHPFHGALNLAFGGYKNTGDGSDLTVAALVKLDPLLHAYNDDKPLIAQLLKNETHRKIYIAQMRTILEDFFWSDRFEETVIEQHELIAPILEANDYDLTRFNNSLLSTTGQRSQIPGLLQLMNNRAAYLKKHPMMTVLPSNIGDITFKKRERYSSQKVQAFEFQIPVDRFPKKVMLHYRLNPKDNFNVIALNDKGEEGDTTANDDIYGIRIPAQKEDTIEYYIFVENSGAVTFEPSNYLMKRHFQSLEALNK
ncbi:MAG: CotH kinase family protein [Bacteroidota bacterium]